MIKYIRYIFASMILCGYVLALDNQSAQGAETVIVSVKTSVDGNYNNLGFRSITDGDAPLVEAINSRCSFKEGLTQNTEKDPLAVNSMAQNLITRQKMGNPYSGLVISRENIPVGFITLGVMSALGFNSGYLANKHAGILKIFEELGALKRKENPDKDAEFASGIFDKVYDCGLAMMVPALPRGNLFLSTEEIRNALRIAISVIQKLKDMKEQLPRGENTVPGILMGLFHPLDLLVPDLEAVGFKIIRDEAIKNFYDKERVLAYIKLK